MKKVIKEKEQYFKPTMTLLELQGESILAGSDPQAPEPLNEDEEGMLVPDEDGADAPLGDW